MQKIRKWLAVAVLMALAAVAYSQTVSQDGQRTDPSRRSLGQGMLIGGINRTDSTLVVPSFSSTGSASVTEASPDRDASFELLEVLPAGAAGTALALSGADSSAVLDTRHMRLGMLVLKCVLGGTGTVDTTCVARLAIQVRTHLSGLDDSTNTAAIYSYGGTTAAGAAQIDSVVYGHIADGTTLTAVSATPSSITPWSGEWVVKVSAKRNAHGNGFAINGHTFYYPSAIAIPLSNLFGRDIYSRYTSIRVRVMTFQKGAASLTTGTVLVKASIVGTPL